MSDALTRALSSQAEGPSTDTIGECEWMSTHCPLVAAMLTSTKHDGKARKTSTVSISFDKNDGKLKAALNDRERRMSLFVTCDDPLNAWQRLEAKLESGAASWRHWNSLNGRG